MFRTKLLVTAGAAATLVTLGMTPASANVSASTAGRTAASVAGIQANSVGCTSARCVITAMNTAGSKARTALLNPATGSVTVTSWSAAGVGAFQIACPDKTTCLALGYAGQTEAISAISTQTGTERVTAKLPTADQYNLFNIACPSSKYCWVDGSSAAPGVQLPTWALLIKVSPAGKILQRTVNKAYYKDGPVACESSTDCLIGRETNKFTFQSMTLINGKFGQPHAYPANFLPFYSSCYSDKLCYSTGTSEITSAEEVTSLNPKTGAPGPAIKLPLTSSTSIGVAESIDCYSATQCVAVGAIPAGSGANQGTEAAYVVIAHGKVGKPVVVSKNLASVFGAVSCATAKECYAVGTYDNPTTQTTASIVAKV